jgi:hypothetical protein
MLRRLRKARFGQIALVIASLLAITGSFGLHPEPGTTTAATARDGFVSWHGPQAPDGASHDCLACLAHRTVTLPRPSGVVLQPVAAVTLLSAPRSGRPLTVDRRTHEGRAPPAVA